MSNEGILITIIVGAFVGWLASVITKRDEEQGWLANIVVGIVGAIIGGILSSAIVGGDRSALAFDLTSIFWATLGAVGLCMILNLITRKRVV